MALGAGRDLNIISTTRSNVSGTASASNPIGHTLSTTQIEHAAGVYVTGTGKADSGTLSLDAGRDVNINGATVSNSAGKVNISAGRDVNLGTVDTQRAESDVSSIVTEGKFAPNFQISSNSVQVGSTITATGDVNIAAGNNLNAIGTHIASSGGSVNLGAKNDVNIVSGGQFIEGYQAQTSGNQGVGGQTAILNNLASTITAAKNVTIDAGHDINIAGAHIAAGADAQTQAQILADSQPLDTTKPTSYQDTLAKPTPTAPTTGTVTLTAGHDVNLMANALQSSTSHEADFGSGNYNKGDGSTQALQPTTLSGATVNITAGQDLTSVASTVTAGTLNLSAGNNLNLLAATLQNNHSEQGYNGDSMTIDQFSRGGKDQTTVYNQINAGTLNVSVGGQINAQIGGTTSIQDLASQPGMGWINTLMNDPANAGKVTWQRIEENHEHWAESSSTLGPVAQAVLVAVVSFATAGAGTAAMGPGASVMTTTVVQAGISSIASQAVVSFANNNGDMAAVMHDLTSNQGIRNILSAIVTAGVLQGLDSSLGLSNATVGNIGQVAGVGWTQVIARNVIDGVAGSLVNAAIQGTSLENALQSGLVTGFVNAAAAGAANEIGNLGEGTLNAFGAAVAHAAAGCLAGAIKGSAGGAGASAGAGCSAGALGATIGELAAGQYLQDNPNATQSDLGQFSRLIGGIFGAVVGGGQAAANIAADAAANAALNNRILHPNDQNMATALARQGPYSKEELLAAMRWSNGRNSNGGVSAATQQGYGADGKPFSGSPTGSLAGDTTYDPGLHVAPQGNGSATSYFQEVLPNAPSTEIMNFITANTGGANSPYQFNTAGMTYGSSASTAENPQYFPCASTTCLLYGANYNPNNPINQAQIQSNQDALLAAGIIVAGPALLLGGPTFLSSVAGYGAYSSGAMGAGVGGGIYTGGTLLTSYIDTTFGPNQGQPFSANFNQNFSVGQFALSAALGYGGGVVGAGAYRALGVPNSGIQQLINPVTWPVILPVRGITAAASATVNGIINRAPGSGKK